MRLWLYIIIALAFTIGNLTWRFVGDPRAFYVPLAMLLIMGAVLAQRPVKKITVRQYIFLDWILLMAFGNLAKQIWYDSNDIKQVSDIWWGIFLAIFFIPKLVYPKIYLKLFKFIKEKWAIIIHILKTILKRG